MYTVLESLMSTSKTLKDVINPNQYIAAETLSRDPRPSIGNRTAQHVMFHPELAMNAKRETRSLLLSTVLAWEKTLGHVWPGYPCMILRFLSLWQLANMHQQTPGRRLQQGQSRFIEANQQSHTTSSCDCSMFVISR